MKENSDPKPAKERNWPATSTAIILLVIVFTIGYLINRYFS